MMKLIDLLVQELPKRGGWPKGVGRISMHDDGAIYFDGSPANNVCDLPQCSDGWAGHMDLLYTNEVTKMEYEASLTAPAWNGEGLPLVGCECEFKSHHHPQWQRGKVKYLSTHTIVIALDNTNSEGVAEFISHPTTLEFRKSGTEAEHKRHEFTTACVRLDNSQDWSYSMAYFGGLYDAIAAGKIPGVKLTD